MFEFIKRYKWLVLTVLMVILGLQILTLNQLKALNHALFEQQVQYQSKTTIENIQQSIKEKQKATTAIALTLSEVLTLRDFNSHHFDSGSQFSQLIDRINQHSDYKNLWVQVVSTEGQSLFRSWSPIRHNLLNIRPEFALIKQSNSPIQSVSSGKFDLSIKVVTPIIIDGQLVGFLDLISHFNSFQKRFEKQGFDSLVVATHERSKMISNPFAQHYIGNYYVALLEPNLGLMNQVTEQELEGWIERHQEAFIWKNKLVMKLPLISPDDQVHGYYFAFKDFSKLDMAHLESNYFVEGKSYWIIADAVLSLLFLAGLALFLMRSQKRYYQNILNSEDEIVLVTNGRNLIDANAQLFKYFKELGIDKKACICDYFISEEGFLQKEMGGMSWIHYLIKHPELEHRALVNVQDNPTIFRLKAQRLSQSEELFVVVLVDITNLVELNENLNKQTLTDSLTQTGNRRYFNQYLTEQLTHVERYNNRLSLISFDIDHFKRVNDTYGHQVGDEVLIQVCDVVFEQLRDLDKFFRIGGEEFLVILVGHSQQEAYLVAERIRHAIVSQAFGEAGKITISLGVAEYRKGEADNQLMNRVDTALYQAKNRGRNLSVMAD